MIADQSERPRIFIVADVETARTYSRWLGSYEVEIASGLPLLLQPPPSLVLIDTEASGVDCFQACASLKAQGAAYPVLLITPANAEAVEQAYQSGADDVLTRPILPAILKQRAAHWLEHAALRETGARMQTMYEQGIRLRESEERYRRIVESYSDITFALAPDTTVTYLSPTFERLTGFAYDDWMEHPFTPLIYFDDLPLALEMFQRVLKGEIPPPFELRFYSNRDTIGYGEVLVQPEWHNREMAGIWGVVRDITKRRRAEEAERQHRLLAEALRDTAAALNATLDRDEVLERILNQVGRVVPSDTANIMIIEDGIARVVGARGYAERGILESVYALRFDIEKTPNMKWMAEQGKPYVLPDVDLFPGWNRQPVLQWIRSHVGAPIRFEGKTIGFLNLDSALVNAFSETDAERLQAFADQAATAIRNADLYNALRQQADELEQRVAERTYELEHERAQLFAILDSLSEGVLYDEMLEVRYINRALTELTGYTIEEWNGYLETLRSETMSEQEMKRMTAALFHTVDQHQLWSNEMSLRRKDGTEFDAALTCRHVLGSDGKIVGAVTVIRDISHEKALQAQKARFVAYASHELRTPLTNLMTRLYLMRRQPGRMEEHLDILESVANRMRFLVEDLLDASRFERGVISLERQIIPLQSLVSEVVDLQQPEAARKQIQLAYSMPDTALPVFVDPKRIVQVMTNLLMNAINYTPSGGAIQVVISTQGESSRVPVAEIAVIDNGIGISEEHLPHIFQPFFRVDSGVEGTGLGLSITQQIVQLHDGEITVESELGRGSIFRVLLPLYGLTAPSSLEMGKDNAIQSA